MTRDEYIEEVLISLGFPTVQVEIQSIIGRLVDRAFREITKYVVETKYLTINYSTKGISLKDYDVESIILVLRTVNPAGTPYFTDIFSLASMSLNASIGSNTNSLLLNNYMYRTQLSQLKSTITTDMDFTYDTSSQILYLNAYYPLPDKVTLVYSPKLKEVSQIKDSYWEDYILRLSIALSKETLGRVRGKYDLSSSLYKLDADALLSEGITERDQIRSELKDEHDIAFPID